ncbi:hypothetical protein Sjap_021225 [Stephania japonica]|uniref:Uncharacterized protein n=1 Tax=Stephania japonica TaxID=461633 RepID=A0AAP0HNU6_9MAGN
MGRFEIHGVMIGCPGIGIKLENVRLHKFSPTRCTVPRVRHPSRGVGSHNASTKTWALVEVKKLCFGGGWRGSATAEPRTVKGRLSPCCCEWLRTIREEFLLEHFGDRINFDEVDEQVAQIYSEAYIVLEICKDMPAWPGQADTYSKAENKFSRNSIQKSASIHPCARIAFRFLPSEQ